MNNKVIAIVIGFFTAALIVAHIVSFVTNSQFWGLCVYPMAWVLMIIVMVIERYRNND